MRFSPLYGAMALVFTSPLYAQDATSSDDELIVSATRTEGSRNDSPQVIKVISEKEIAQQRQITSDTPRRSSAIYCRHFRLRGRKCPAVAKRFAGVCRW